MEQSKVCLCFEKAESKSQTQNRITESKNTIRFQNRGKNVSPKIILAIIAKQDVHRAVHKNTTDMAPQEGTGWPMDRKQSMCGLGELDS